ncbi:monofunctional biosynthetic peptidoglycan transglycosylase [uncultured Paludibaculum sp.]|uniref:monofunctional biosynthetic peptidoglycan transglycosylase n=1 Tax=uncultured Paludibaculum sp. TaxID=1765020 RepID=UPI002AAB3BC4|nr:monofunctional biosynthetic peptidoglycan transglycosylase [uncultured Paludibaculum sp.]
MRKLPRVRQARPLWRRLLVWVLYLVLGYYALIVVALAGLRFIDPPFTGVHVQRRVESWFKKGRYQKRYTFVPLGRISPNFQWAVIAAEDGHFYKHHGFDWEQIRDAVEDGMEDGRIRGASTISQQLVKNLFFTTAGSAIRKGLEFTITPLAELILGKKRILELYLNVIEWGPGVFGAEAAAQYHYHTSAARIGRDQGARLAAILPSPLRRSPGRMDRYSAIILTRMGQLGR